MIDIRLARLADTIIDYSLNIQPGERVLIESSKNCSEMLKYMIRKIADRGAIPLVQLNETTLRASLITNGSVEQFKLMEKHQRSILSDVDVYINMLDSDNSFDMSSVPSDKRKIYQEYYFKPINFEIIIPNKRWITVEYPSVAAANRFCMNSNEFEDYFFKAVNCDYADLSRKMNKLKELMDKTKSIKISALETEFYLETGGNPAAICDGKINIPDGEIFLGPKPDSASGEIKFNTPSKYMGSIFNDLKLTFVNGKLIKAITSSNQKKLDEIVNTDEGSRFIGEFAIGTNSSITVPTNNIIFDEKICGSFHIALGASHHLSDNGNVSAIHWDIVQMLTKKYGGGSIYFDNELIQKDGIFVTEELKQLNKTKKRG